MKQFAGLLFLYIVLLFSIVGNADSGMISDLCNHSDDPKLCISSIKSRPESDEFASITYQIEIIAISAASANASATSAYIKKKLSRSEATLEDCQKNYLDAAKQLDDSNFAMLADAHTDVDVWERTAISTIESCGNALDSRAGNNAELLKLCETVLMINKKLP